MRKNRIRKKTILNSASFSIIVLSYFGLFLLCLYFAVTVDDDDRVNSIFLCQIQKAKKEDKEKKRNEEKEEEEKYDDALPIVVL